MFGRNHQRKMKIAAPYKIYNIGNNKPENLLYFVETLEKCLMAEGIIRKPAEKELLPMQPEMCTRHMPM